MASVKHVIRHFRRVDPVLASVIPRIGFPGVHRSDDYFSDLCEGIINQQLSSKAGDTIWTRFQKLFPHRQVSPGLLLSLSDSDVRAVGISRGKCTYLKNLAEVVASGKLKLRQLERLPDEKVVTELTMVKGIGPWTAEMFLMFSLGREDVFSVGDVGLRNAIKKLYNFKKDPTPQQMEKISSKWAPYRTWAARILWRSLDSSI